MACNVVIPLRHACALRTLVATLRGLFAELYPWEAPTNMASHSWEGVCEDKSVDGTGEVHYLFSSVDSGILSASLRGVLTHVSPSIAIPHCRLDVFLPS